MQVGWHFYDLRWLRSWGSLQGTTRMGQWWRFLLPSRFFPQRNIVQIPIFVDIGWYFPSYFGCWCPQNHSIHSHFLFTCTFCCRLQPPSFSHQSVFCWLPLVEGHHWFNPQDCCLMWQVLRARSPYMLLKSCEKSNFLLFKSPYFVLPNAEVQIFGLSNGRINSPYPQSSLRFQKWPVALSLQVVQAQCPCGRHALMRRSDILCPWGRSESHHCRHFVDSWGPI